MFHFRGSNCQSSELPGWLSTALTASIPAIYPGACTQNENQSLQYPQIQQNQNSLLFCFFISSNHLSNPWATLGWKSPFHYSWVTPTFSQHPPHTPRFGRSSASLWLSRCPSLVTSTKLSHPTRPCALGHGPKCTQEKQIISFVKEAPLERKQSNTGPQIKHCTELASMINWERAWE